jgi:hypothetical protein
MPDAIEEIMRVMGPCLSSDLADALVKAHKISPATARKRISRHKNLKRLAYLPFPRNARFVYLQRDYASPKFWRALSKALIDNTLSHGGALAALMARGGLMPQRHFEIACGAPFAQKKHLSPAVILQRLTKAQLLQLVDVPGVGVCVSLSQQAAPSSYEGTRVQARLVAEDVLLKAIRMWIKNLSLASYKAVAVRDEGAEQPRVGTFRWDLTGPSYLAPMVEWKASTNTLKPGFIACDILLGREVTALHLRPFITKCQTLRSLKGVGRCLQIFVAERYDKAALRLAKETGIVPATPASLFGDEVAEALGELIRILSTAAEFAVDPAKFDELFRRLGKIEGAATNLRGALFEYLAADIVRQSDNCVEVRMNQVIVDPENLAQRAEVDIVAVTRPRGLRFIECKGYRPGGTVPDEMVRAWLEKRVPLVRRAALAHAEWQSRKMTFEFWTTGNLSAASRELVRNAQQSISLTKYTVVVREGRQLEDLAKDCQDPALWHTLAEHFLEHPLQTIDRHLQAVSERERRRAMTRTPAFEDVNLDDVIDSFTSIPEAVAPALPAPTDDLEL